MQKSTRRIVSAATGLLLSIALGACASRPPAEPLTQTVAVAVKSTPPADLLVCPDAPEGFPTDTWAVMPASVRDGVMRLAKAYGELRGRFDRLATWNGGQPCGTPNAQDK
jgi:hypothetical protein